MTYTAADVRRIYLGSNGEATRALYAYLESIGPMGHIAVNLFRACKASERAKVYRGGGYKGAAYDRKQWSIDNVVRVLDLERAGEALGIRWGWGVDAALKERGDPHHFVLYVDLPTGQVSFHTAHRASGPDYPDAWDGVRQQSAARICDWVGQLVEEPGKVEAA